jgi:hypothetical protein
MSRGPLCHRVDYAHRAQYAPKLRRTAAGCKASATTALRAAADPATVDPLQRPLPRPVEFGRLRKYVCAQPFACFEARISPALGVIPNAASDPRVIQGALPLTLRRAGNGALEPEPTAGLEPATRSLRA